MWEIAFFNALNAKLNSNLNTLFVENLEKNNPAQIGELFDASVFTEFVDTVEAIRNKYSNLIDLLKQASQNELLKTNPTLFVQNNFKESLDWEETSYAQKLFNEKYDDPNNSAFRDDFDAQNNNSENSKISFLKRKFPDEFTDDKKSARRTQFVNNLVAALSNQNFQDINQSDFSRLTQAFNNFAERLPAFQQVAKMWFMHVAQKSGANLPEQLKKELVQNLEVMGIPFGADEKYEMKLYSKLMELVPKNSEDRKLIEEYLNFITNPDAILEAFAKESTDHMYIFRIARQSLIDAGKVDPNDKNYEEKDVFKTRYKSLLQVYEKRYEADKALCDTPAKKAEFYAKPYKVIEYFKGVTVDNIPAIAEGYTYTMSVDDRTKYPGFMNEKFAKNIFFSHTHSHPGQAALNKWLGSLGKEFLQKYADLLILMMNDETNPALKSKLETAILYAAHNECKAVIADSVEKWKATQIKVNELCDYIKTLPDNLKLPDDIDMLEDILVKCADYLGRRPEDHTQTLKGDACLRDPNFFLKIPILGEHAELSESLTAVHRKYIESANVERKIEDEFLKDVVQTFYPEKKIGAAHVDATEQSLLGGLKVAADNRKDLYAKAIEPLNLQNNNSMATRRDVNKTKGTDERTLFLSGAVDAASKKQATVSETVKKSEATKELIDEVLGPKDKNESNADYDKRREEIGKMPLKTLEKMVIANQPAAVASNTNAQKHSNTK